MTGMIVIKQEKCQGTERQDCTLNVEIKDFRRDSNEVITRSISEQDCLFCLQDLKGNTNVYWSQTSLKWKCNFCLALKSSSIPVLSGRDRLGSEGASLQELGGSRGARGRASGRAALEPRSEQLDGHCGVGRPHQRHRRHLRHPGGRFRWGHPLPPATHPAAEARRVDAEGSAPLEPAGSDQLHRGSAGLPPTTASTARWAIQTQEKWLAQECSPTSVPLSLSVPDYVRFTHNII